MGFVGLVFCILFGIIFYIIINYLNAKYDLSKSDKLIFSIILMLLTAGICYRLGFVKCTDNIFLTFVFMMIIDILFSSYIIDDDFFDPSEGNVKYYIILIIVGFIINQEFINNVSEVFLTGDDLRIILWTAAMLFVYNFSRNKKIFTNVNTGNNKQISINSILSNYAKFKYFYYDECDDDNRELSNVLYAIMIYENNRRNKFMRRIDNAKYRINGGKCRLGIMQVESKKFISDIESIDIVHKKLIKIYNKKSIKSAHAAIKDYYGYENNSVNYIFDTIKKF